jgi:phenylacetic acid degradation operon negative regulatory protein
MSNRIATATAALVNRFRRQRPLRGGSLLITLFGDSIAPRGGAITIASLIRIAAPFGLNELLVRTAMTRLANDGWLERRRIKRFSEYLLSDEGKQRFAPATQQIYAEPLRPWLGSWTLVLLPPDSAPDRAAAREALGWAGFGEPFPGVFAHPAPPIEDIAHLIRRTPALARAVVLSTEDNPEAPHRRLANLAWNLEDLALRYRRLISHFEPVRAALAAGTPSPLQAFVIRTLLIHEYRKVHLRDPLLPADLLPADWAGADAYRLCRALYQRAVPLAEEYLSTHAMTLRGPLPPANSELHGRFGGIVV